MYDILIHLHFSMKSFRYIFESHLTTWLEVEKVHVGTRDQKSHKDEMRGERRTAGTFINNSFIIGQPGSLLL